MICRQCGTGIDTSVRRSDGTAVCPGCGAVYRPKAGAASDPLERFGARMGVFVAAAAALLVLGGAVLFAARLRGGEPEAAPVYSSTPANTQSHAELPVREDAGDDNAAPACRAYLSLLLRERQAIGRYTWQMGYYGWDTPAGEQTPRPVVLRDICGDDTPELIYIAQQDRENAYMTRLNIVTWEDGQLRVLYEANWDSLTGGGFGYCLYQAEGDRTLRAYTCAADLYSYRSYCAFEEGPAGKFLLRTELSEHSHPGDTASWGAVEYTCESGGKSVGKDEFERVQADVRAGMADVLMYNILSGDFVRGFVSRHGCAAMTYDEAAAYLESAAGSDTQRESRMAGLREALWYDAYRRYVMKRSSADAEAEIGLHDMDGDGVPELLVSGSSGNAYRVFSCIDGQAVSIGKAGGRECPLYFYPGSDYPGLFCVKAADGEYTVSYYVREGGAVVRETVERGSYYDGMHAGDDFDTWRANGTIRERTKDEALFSLDAGDAGRTYLLICPAGEIAAMGWDTFVAAAADPLPIS